MARDPAHRTSSGILRKLAAHHVFYEFGEAPHGLWNTFSTRNIGFAVGRRMARRFKRDLDKMCETAVAAISQILGLDPENLDALERSAFREFAILLSLVPDLKRWTTAEKQALRDIIRAKVAADETGYLRRLQRHGTLRKTVLRLGSATDGTKERAVTRKA